MVPTNNKIHMQFGDPRFRSSFCVRYTKILCRIFSRRACARVRAHLGFSFFSLSADIFPATRLTTLRLFLVLFNSSLEVSFSWGRGTQWCSDFWIWTCGCGDTWEKHLWQKFWWWRRPSVVRRPIFGSYMTHFFSLSSLSVLFLLLLLLVLFLRLVCCCCHCCRCWRCCRRCWISKQVLSISVVSDRV